MNDLSEKVAWVTGAGTGIGEAAAVALAGAGAAVVLSGRREDVLEGVASTIRDNGGKASVAALDVSDAAAVQAVVDGIQSAHGRLDILVHSAGINRPNRMWGTAKTEDWDQVVRTNLDGTYYCNNAVLPIMRAQQDGLIVNVSSWAGRYMSYISGMPYTATKSAVNALTETINMEECVNGIRACALCPGEVATPILDERPVRVTDEERAKMLQPEDLGEVVLFLARLHPRVCVNDLLVSPTWNRFYVALPGR